MNGKIVMSGVYENGIKSGVFTSYYSNGQIESQGRFLKNHRSGVWSYFYPDGKSLQEVEFHQNNFEPTNEFFVIESFDPDGKLLVKDGTGSWIYTYEEFGLPQTITLKGAFLNGKKEGEWVCFFGNGEFLYKEIFKNDRFKSGYLTNPDGSKHEKYKNEFQNKLLPHYKYGITERFTYRVGITRNDYPFFTFLRKPYIPRQSPNPNDPVFIVVEQPPEYEGGFEAMFKFIGKSMKYPESARKMKIQGSVLVSFIIETDGTITEALISKGISADCDKEALRIINTMPKWRPGTQSGKPVRVKFVLPVKFKL